MENDLYYEINDTSKLRLINKNYNDSIRISKQYNTKKGYKNEIKIYRYSKDKSLFPKQYSNNDSDKIIVMDYLPFNLESMIETLNITSKTWNDEYADSLIKDYKIISNLINKLILLHKNNIYHNDFKAKNIRLTALGDIVIFDYTFSEINDDDNTIERNNIDDTNMLKYILLQIIYCLPYKEVYPKNKYNKLVSNLGNKLVNNKKISTILPIDNIKKVFELNKNNLDELHKIFNYTPKVESDNKKSDEKILSEFLDKVKFNDLSQCSSKAYKENFFMKKNEIIDLINKTPEIKNILPKNLNKYKKEEICDLIFKISSRNILPTPEVLDEYKDLNEITNILLKYDKEEPVNFICYPSMQKYLYLYILSKHKKSCMLDFYNDFKNNKYVNFTNKDKKNYKDKKDFINFHDYLSIPFRELKEKSFKKKILENYEKCAKNNKLLCMHLSLTKHANMLVFNHKLKQIERYEPHGISTHPVISKEGKIVDSYLEELAKYFRNNGKIEFTKDIRYASSKETCPMIPKKIMNKFLNLVNKEKGLQVFDGTYKQKKQAVKILNTTFSDPHGFCCMWSYLYMDYRLYNPKLPGDELGNKLLEKFKDLKGDEILSFIRRYIRGYTQEILTDLLKVLKSNENLFILFNVVELIDLEINDYQKKKINKKEFENNKGFLGSEYFKLQKIFNQYITSLYVKILDK